MTDTDSTKRQIIRVRIVYRNYRPIHKIYQSIIDNPPPGISYKVPQVKRYLRILFPLYRRFRYFTPGRIVIRAAEKIFFSKKSVENVDIYHYICMMDTSPPDKPYVVDVEHIASLLSFTYNIDKLNEVKAFLENPNCKSINCQSRAASRTVEQAFGRDFAKIKQKVHIVYPSLNLPDKKLKSKYTYINKDDNKLKILFVGNRAYLKGLEELLEAISQINQKYSVENLGLHIISDDAKPIVNKYNLPNIYLYEPRFSFEEMICLFYLPADVLISPTKQDTYGMTIIEALSCGTPAIATKQFAIPELIDDGKDGILLKTKKIPYLDKSFLPERKDIVAAHHSNLDMDMTRQLTGIIADVIDGKLDLKKLKGKGINKFESGGRLSVARRNEQLLTIYRKALLDNEHE